MNVIGSQLVWLLLSYLATKLASKTWGRVVLQIGRGYLASRSGSRATDLGRRLDSTRPLTPEERARLSNGERRIVDHQAREAG